MTRLKDLVKTLLLLQLYLVFTNVSLAQSYPCVFKDTLFNIDFGSASKVQLFNLNMLKNYRFDNSNCPPDGFYAFPSHTANCFNNDWFNLSEDHTPGDEDGKMMFINSSAAPGLFFVATLSGFKPSTNYEFGVWIMNLCRLHSGCPPIPPDISILLETTDGKKLSQFGTGVLSQDDVPKWKRYYGFFTTPANATSLILKMVNFTPGGCGNDFAMDDITVRECYSPVAEIKEPQVPLIKQAPVSKAVTPKKNEALPALKKNKSVFQKKQDSIKKVTVAEITPLNIPVPERIRTRENPVVKEITVPAGEVLIQLYDNGIIDGDTVSIYHNNELIVSRAGISEKAVTIKIPVDAAHPHHEIVMVADNLGSIPPNTSLMIVTAKGLRKEVFISSTEQKNAKIIIDFKE